MKHAILIISGLTPSAPAAAAVAAAFWAATAAAASTETSQSHGNKSVPHIRSSSPLVTHLEFDNAQV
jgi:hypothetical protein